MRERRWESVRAFTFDDVLTLGERLASLGLAPATPAKDVICYIEEWAVDHPQDFDQLDPWSTEDVTLLLAHEKWEGDFFLFAGGYHTVYERYRALATYCSISHPWMLPGRFVTLQERAMFWLGFRHKYGFIRVRLQTTEVVAPGQTRADPRRELWIHERAQAFVAARDLLGIPIVAKEDPDRVVLTAETSDVAFFCSWPDAFGPSQFEYNTSDPYEFLVPASRLAATCSRTPVTVRTYLTGFPESVLEEFLAIHPGARPGYRCSAHCPLDELPEILRAIAPAGRLYATLCEFQTEAIRPDGRDASAVVGVVGVDGGFRVEVRLNRAHLPEDQMSGWLEDLLGLPVVYAPLPAFP